MARTFIVAAIQKQPMVGRLFIFGLRSSRSKLHDKTRESLCVVKITTRHPQRYWKSTRIGLPPIPLTCSWGSLLPVSLKSNQLFTTNSKHEENHHTGCHVSRRSSFVFPLGVCRSRYQLLRRSRPDSELPTRNHVVCRR